MIGDNTRLNHFFAESKNQDPQGAKYQPKLKKKNFSSQNKNLKQLKMERILKITF